MPNTIFGSQPVGDAASATHEPHVKFAPPGPGAKPGDLEQLKQQLLRMIINSEARRRRSEPEHP